MRDFTKYSLTKYKPRSKRDVGQEKGEIWSRTKTNNNPNQRMNMITMIIRFIFHFGRYTTITIKNIPSSNQSSLQYTVLVVAVKRLQKNVKNYSPAFDRTRNRKS